MSKPLALILAAAVLCVLATQGMAQTNIYAGGLKEVKWDANCNETKTFVNKTQRPICDLRIIKSKGTNNVFIRDLIVEDGIGQWLVDDNVNGNVGDANDNNTEDSTPDATSRIQRSPGPPPAGRRTGQCIRKDAAFGIRICGDNTGTPADDNIDLDVNDFEFTLKPTSESGADIVAMAECQDGSNLVALDNATSNNPFLLFSVQGANENGDAIKAMTIAALDEGIQIRSVNAVPTGEFVPAEGRFIFETPVARGGLVTLDFQLTQLSSTDITKVQISPCLVPVGVPVEEPPRGFPIWAIVLIAVVAVAVIAFLSLRGRAARG